MGVIIFASISSLILLRRSELKIKGLSSIETNLPSFAMARLHASLSLDVFLFPTESSTKSYAYSLEIESSFV